MSIKQLTIFIILVLLLPVGVFSADRTVPYKAELKKCTIRFNGDYLKGSYVIVDARSAEEKAKNISEGKLSGLPIVFLQGHNQRANSSYNLTCAMALNSKSGIIIVPVVDTPFGENTRWRGDSGKDVINMQIVRLALKDIGISVDGYNPLTDLKVNVNGLDVPDQFDPNLKLIPTKLMAMGWSHGGILVRRFAHAYQGTINDLIQMCPAGFEDYGSNSCTSATCLLTSFSIEGLVIGGGVFRGEMPYIWDSTAGIIKGQSSDYCRSAPSCMFGNFHVLKPFRQLYDTAQASFVVYDDKIAPQPYNINGGLEAGQLQHIVTIFGISDTLFEIENVEKGSNRNNITEKDREKFFATYYPANVKNGTKMTLLALKGNHNGPVTFSDLWAKSALEGTEQLREAVYIDEKTATAEAEKNYKTFNNLKK